MEKLLKPSEYAKRLGISRQAVYAKIKKGLLPIKHVDGKLYVVSNDISDNPKKVDNVQEELFAAKEETIRILKQTIEDLKASNKEIATTLRGEIELLKEAFNEMRRLYSERLQLHGSEGGDEVAIAAQIEEVAYLSPKALRKALGLKKRYKKALKHYLKEAYASGSEYVKKEENGKLLVRTDIDADAIKEALKA